MFLLLTYILIALVFSFLCSIAEAVILSVSNAYIALQDQAGHPTGVRLKKLKQDINRPLAAILTLNTIAHTVGAAGAGAQAAVVFGSAYVGLASAILTLMILVLSEIIPKTLGAHYWRQLAPITAWSLVGLIVILYPFVRLSEYLTDRLTQTPGSRGVDRQELAALAQLSAEEGHIATQESRILVNLLRLRETRVKDAMTPRTVIFSLQDQLTVEAFFHKYDHVRFSRIPLINGDSQEIEGFVLRSDMLLAQARGNGHNSLANYRRDLPVMLDSMNLSQAFEEFLRRRAHIMLVVNEYGDTAGLITLEDLLETLLGLEIIDEGDREVDMQALARRLWRRRAQAMGLDPSLSTGGERDASGSSTHGTKP